MEYDRRALAVAGLSPHHVYYSLRNILVEDDAEKMDITSEEKNACCGTSKHKGGI
jgi:hypothetical protein